MNGISHAGLPFTDSSKPTFCVQLKVQLDRFLSTWGEEQLPKGGRTAGSATDITKHLRRLLGMECLLALTLVLGDTTNHHLTKDITVWYT